MFLFRLTNSRPITPAPITIIFSGTFESFKAPVEETTVSSSIFKVKIVLNNFA